MNVTTYDNEVLKRARLMYADAYDFADPQRVARYNADIKKAAMLKELNQNLFKNVVNKEKTNLHRTLYSWREGPEMKIAEEKARAKFVEFVD